jgi:trehalose 6-phosphate synthase/phosphatase
MPRPAQWTGPNGRSLVVVSNREPYQHVREPDGSIRVVSSPGGVAVALDALMTERGGVWIAHGSGDADRDVVDHRDCTPVPPDAPAYQLCRIWLSAEEHERYYGGFSNQGLWPLCHMAHVQPVFRTEDWLAYRTVNQRFAAAIADHVRRSGAPVFIQDYHLALVAHQLRRLIPDPRIALFWHIPFPTPERLRMCPWRKDVLSGLLGNDFLAFQLEEDKENFLRALRQELSAAVHVDRVFFRGQDTRVAAVPIGVDFGEIQRMAVDPSLPELTACLSRDFGLDDPDVDIVGLGVDRLDYTKGIAERLEAIDQLLTLRPDLRGRFAFVQIGVPSRSELPAYADVEGRIDAMVAAINARHRAASGRGPIRYRKTALDMPGLVALYRRAHLCVVSSLHDGMNLVAKEFVAARVDEDGVLVLSEMTGAARELREALLVNPYYIDGFARALEAAVTMPRGERPRRMRALRRTVARHDVFRWASEILDGFAHHASAFAAAARLT